MKACSDRRMSIALLAVGALPSGEADAICRHLDSCAGCRAHREELAAVAEDQARAAAEGSDPELPATVLRRVATAIRVGSTGDAAAIRRAPHRPWLAWVGAAAAAVIAIVAVAVVVRRGRDAGPDASVVAARPTAPGVVASPVPANGSPPAIVGMEPDLGAFRIALNRSEAEFERRFASGRSGSSGLTELKFRPGAAGVDFGW